jgi:hypothetical protein
MVCASAFGANALAGRSIVLDLGRKLTPAYRENNLIQRSAIRGKQVCNESEHPYLKTDQQ